MQLIKFIKPRLNFGAGHVVDRDSLPSGVVKTLFDFGVIEEVKDGSILVRKENVESVQPTAKPRRRKKSSKAKPDRHDS